MVEFAQALIVLIVFILLIALTILLIFYRKRIDERLRYERKLRKTLSELRKKEQQTTKQKNELEKAKLALMNMMDDLTDSYEKLKELDELKSDFVINVSHELRTPLTTTRLAFDLYDKQKDPKKKKEILEMVRRNVDRLHITVHNILDFSIIDAGKLTLEKKPFSLKTVVKTAIEQEQTQADVKKIKLQMDISPLLKITGDKEWITHVISNLIDNSIKFTDRGFIKVSAKRQKDYIIVSVKDTGRGVHKRDLPKIFDKFAKLERYVPGSGIGLWISKSIVEKHGGKIWIKSKRGKGTQVSFSLPLRNKK